MSRPIGGPIAAPLTVRNAAGELDETGFRRQLELLLQSGVAGICVNGATGEFIANTLDERRRLVQWSRGTMGSDGILVAGIGAARLEDVVRSGREALEAGADALLFPPPYFFPYEPGDLEAFYREAAARIGGPILIYNLPSFTTPVTTALALRLVQSVDGIIGLKDSGSNLATLRALTEQAEAGTVRLVGNDAMLAEALRTGCADGVISGVAGVLPELTVSIFRAHRNQDIEGFRTRVALLDELIARVDAVPVPWGLKFVARARGLPDPGFLWPLSPARQRQEAAFRRWFEGWWRRCLDCSAASATQPAGPVPAR